MSRVKVEENPLDCLEYLKPEVNRDVREKERAQHRRVLGLIMPAMSGSAARDLQMMSGYLEARENRNLHDMFFEAVRYRGQFRRGIAAGGPTPNTVANLQTAEEIVTRITLVTKLARMQQFAEPGEKSGLQAEVWASEVLPDDEKDFWITCADALLQDGGIDRLDIAAGAGRLALSAGEC